MGESMLYKVIGIVLALSIVLTIVTTNIVSITAITLLKSGGGAAVGGTGTQTNTTEAAQAVDTQQGGSVSPDDTTPSNTAQGTGTQGTGQTNQSGGNTGTTKSGGTNTTTAAAQKSNADIAKLYNEALNKTKAYKGNVKIKRVEGVTTVVTKLALVKSIAQGMLPNTYPETREGTFSNGLSTADKRVKKDGDTKEFDPGTKLANYLPPPEGKNATLAAAGIKDAKHTAVGGGYKLEITLIQEAGDGINYLPTHHASVMDTLSMSDKDLEPFTVINATTTYSGATITVNVNANGLITSLSILETVNVTGVVTYGDMKQGLDAILDGNWKQDITFTY